MFPLLWNLIINDLLQNILPHNTEILAFTYDIIILMKSNIFCHIQILINIKPIPDTWAKKYKLQFNSNECQYTIFSRKPQILSFKKYLQEQQINRATSLKYS